MFVLSMRLVTSVIPGRSHKRVYARSATRVWREPGTPPCTTRDNLYTWV